MHTALFCRQLMLKNGPGDCYSSQICVHTNDRMVIYTTTRKNPNTVLCPIHGDVERPKATEMQDLM